MNDLERLFDVKIRFDRQSADSHENS